MTLFPKHLTIFWLLAAACLLPGCTVGPAYHIPAATSETIPSSFKEVSDQNKTWQVAKPNDSLPHGAWWEIFGDAELSGLEAKLNANNQNIKASYENFMEARTLIGQAQSQLYPTVGTSASVTRGRPASLNGTTAAPQATLFSLPLNASWVPDLWGKVRNAIHQSEYNAQLSAADLENEKLTEQASLAVYFFELRGQDALRKIFDDTVKEDQQALDLARARVRSGIDQQISVIEAENTLENAQAAFVNLEVARAQYEHAIAMLIGVPASIFSLPVKPLEAAPPAVPLGMPSQLLERRPDVAAAERAMAASNAQIGIAYAAYYPSLTLSAGVGVQSSTLSKLFTWPSFFWSVGPSLAYTIYDAGLRRAEVQQYIATYNAAVANYRQTALTAFQQVEDGLSTVRLLSQQLTLQKMAVQTAEAFVRTEMYRYKLGLDPYINLVQAQMTLLTDQQALANVKTQEMTATVQLVEALGGGWDRSQLPPPEKVAERVKEEMAK